MDRPSDRVNLDGIGAGAIVKRWTMGPAPCTSSWAWSFHTFAIWGECSRLGWKRVPGVDVVVDQAQGIDTYAMTR